MTLGVDLGKAGIPDCDHTVEGESKEEVLAKVREHLEVQHGRSTNDELMNSVALLIGPVKK